MITIKLTDSDTLCTGVAIFHNASKSTTRLVNKDGDVTEIQIEKIEYIDDGRKKFKPVLVESCTKPTGLLTVSIKNSDLVYTGCKIELNVQTCTLVVYDSYGNSSRIPYDNVEEIKLLS